ncbi:hypothetical protein RND81_10G055600 [Saponaria officinalis]|uniref:Uncharacterized protein n=1 Tax=Saponaria officinalis TaxID=3572 RepID=A0AAW1I157_SAPOF
MDFDHQTKLKTAESLLTALSSVSDHSRSTALSSLRLLSKTDPSFRPIFSSLHGGAALSYLSDSLFSTSPLTQDDAAAALLNLSISSRSSLISSPGLLDALSHALSLHRGEYSPAAVQSIAATVYSLSLDPSHRATIGSKRDLVYFLVDIVSYSNSPSRSLKDAVKALFGLSLHPPNRQTILSFDALPALFGRVVHDRRVGLVEDVTAVVAQLAACDAAPAAFGDVRGIRVLVDLIDLGENVTVRVRENAVSALLKLVEFGGEKVAEEIREVGLGLIFNGLGEVVDCGSDKGKLRAQALMNVLEMGMSSTINLEHNEGDFGSGPLSESSRSY